jgi:hypothetical protein
MIRIRSHSILQICLLQPALFLFPSRRVLKGSPTDSNVGKRETHAVKVVMHGTDRSRTQEKVRAMESQNPNLPFQNSSQEVKNPMS